MYMLCTFWVGDWPLRLGFERTPNDVVGDRRLTAGAWRLTAGAWRLTAGARWLTAAALMSYIAVERFIWLFLQQFMISFLWYRTKYFAHCNITLQSVTEPERKNCKLWLEGVSQRYFGIFLFFSHRELPRSEMIFPDQYPDPAWFRIRPDLDQTQYPHPGLNHCLQENCSLSNKKKTHWTTIYL